MRGASRPVVVLSPIAAALLLVLPASSGALRPRTALAEAMTAEAPSRDVVVFGTVRVNTRTGNVLVQHRLLEARGPGPSLDFELSWNSERRDVTSPWGTGWSFSHGIGYARTSTGDVTILWGDGRRDTYARTDTGFDAPRGVNSTLAADGAGAVTLTTPAGTSVVFGDPSHQKVTEIRDRNGNAVTFSYDSGARLGSVTDGSGRSYDFVYDANGRLTQLRDGSLLPERVLVVSQDAQGRLVSAQDACGGTRGFAYDAEGLLTGVTSPRGNTVTVEWSTPAAFPQTRLPSRATLGGASVSLAFDRATRTTTVTSPSGAATRFEHDESTALTRMIDPAGNSVDLTWDANHRLTAVRDRVDAATYGASYDGRGNLIEVVDPLGSTVRTTFVTDPPLGDRPATVTDARGHAWSGEYDARGNLVRVVDPLGNATVQTYDAKGNVVTTTDPTGVATTFTYDARGDLVGTRDALGNSVQYTRDGAGRVTAIVDERGQTWQMTYDGCDRVVSLTNPLGRSWTREYDADGNLVRHVDAKGQETTFTYDARGRLAGAAYDDGTTATYTYDGNGNLTAAQDANSHATFEYDALDRLTRSTDVALGVSTRYEYDERGNCTRKVGPAGATVDYAYDAAGRRTGIVDPSGTSTFTFDAAGNLVTNVRPNGVTSTYVYDGPSRLTAIRHVAPGGATLQAFDYARDDAGRVTNTGRETGETVTFGYDGAGRLVSEAGGVGTGVYENTSTLDAAGNRTETSRTAEGMAAATFDAASRPTSSGGVVLRYDPNGSLIERERSPTDTDIYVYDARNRLVEFRSASATGPVRITWSVFDQVVRVDDPDGPQRDFVYSGDKPVAEFDKDGALTGEVTQVCLYAVRDVASATTVQLHPGGNLPGSNLFGDSPLTLVTGPSGALFARASYHEDGTARKDDTDLVGVPSAASGWFTGSGGFHHAALDAVLQGGMAFDLQTSQPLNPGVGRGNSQPGATSPQAVRLAVRLRLATTPTPGCIGGRDDVCLRCEGPTGTAQAGYISDLRGPATYTFVRVADDLTSGVTSSGAGSRDVKITLYGEDSRELTSTRSTIYLGATWASDPVIPVGPPIGVSPPNFEDITEGGDAEVWAWGLEFLPPGSNQGGYSLNPDSGAVAGTVTNLAGDPVAAYVRSISGLSAAAGADGQFRIVADVPGLHTIVAQSGDDASPPTVVEIVPGAQTPLYLIVGGPLHVRTPALLNALADRLEALGERPPKADRKEAKALGRASRALSRYREPDASGVRHVNTATKEVVRSETEDPEVQLELLALLLAYQEESRRMRNGAEQALARLDDPDSIEKVQQRIDEADAVFAAGAAAMATDLRAAAKAFGRALIMWQRATVHAEKLLAREQ